MGPGPRVIHKTKNRAVLLLKCGEGMFNCLRVANICLDGNRLAAFSANTLDDSGGHLGIGAIVDSAPPSVADERDRYLRAYAAGASRHQRAAGGCRRLAHARIATTALWPPRPNDSLSPTAKRPSLGSMGRGSFPG